MTTEKNIIEVAWKQRYLLLLQKVKSSQALSKAEITELQKYERLSAKAKTSAPEPKTKTKKKRRARSTEAEVRLLGLECENMTEADAAIRASKPLKEIFEKKPKLRKAWERGRFLRNLRGLAGTVIDVSKAAKKLGLANGQVLRAMIDEDMEVGDLWDQTRLELFIEFQSAIVDEAKEGNPAAIKLVEKLLLEEKAGSDLNHITTLQLTEITGKARQRIHEWCTKFGLPRNADMTFDLGIFFAWYEGFLLKRDSVPKGSANVLDPLKQMKAEKLKVELASHRNQLLDRNEVICSLVSWAQHIVTFCERSVEELSRLCSSQPREKIAEIHRSFFRDLHTETGKVPKELRLPAAKEKELIDFLKGLKPHDDRGDHKT